MVANQDIGFVEAGQLAVVKVDAFPFTRYGTIEAIVERFPATRLMSGCGSAERCRECCKATASRSRLHLQSSASLIPGDYQTGTAVY